MDFKRTVLHLNHRCHCNISVNKLQKPRRFCLYVRSEGRAGLPVSVIRAALGGLESFVVKGFVHTAFNCLEEFYTLYICVRLAALPAKFRLHALPIDKFMALNSEFERTTLEACEGLEQRGRAVAPE